MLNANAFAIPEFDTPDQSRQGTEGRNQLRAFDAVQTDLSVRRNFTLHEELHLSIGWMPSMCSIILASAILRMSQITRASDHPRRPWHKL